jgi:3-hydroxyacyl-CoA dehydrogenase/enoyl-CoA hydratase/3-hydroxybutyryl-CoA epimerase
MVELEGRKGKKVGQGFYDYAPDGTKALWPRLREFASSGAHMEMPIADARDRLLAAPTLETVRCLEGAGDDASQCDVGAATGWGFSPWTGGPLSWMDRMGVRTCEERCSRQAGPALWKRTVREPPAALRELALSGTPMYEAKWPLR